MVQIDNDQNRRCWSREFWWKLEQQVRMIEDRDEKTEELMKIMLVRSRK